jgi:hypothetical protein
MAAGTNTAALDFDSVQRGNPEIQRRAQEVINHCWALGEVNPVLAIHDVGAGGISNAFPELVDGAGKGATFDLRRVPLEETGLAPKEIWSNESQERYVLAINPDLMPLFQQMCERERCPFAVVGVTTDARELILEDGPGGERVIDMPMDVLLGKPPKTHRDVQRVARTEGPLQLTGVKLDQVAMDVLRHPTVASKRFLVTIGDRTVGGLNHRDQMVGPWQVPVADCAVTLADFAGLAGEAMAMGERTPLAAINAPASGRMAVGEAITNLLAAPIELSRVKLSANWMAACGEPGEDAALYDTVQAVGLELCPALGIGIPVGKDSLSMRTRWQAEGGARQVTAPVSLIVTAFATLADVRGTLTPQLQAQDSVLILVDLGRGRNRMGGSVLAQTEQQFGGAVPDLDDAELLKSLVAAVNALRPHAAGLPRPQRRRPVGGGLRDGLRRPPRSGAQPRHAAGRLGRAGGGRRRQELGPAGQRPAPRAVAARAVQRGAGRAAAGACCAARRRLRAAARPWPCRAQPCGRQAERRQGPERLARLEVRAQAAAVRGAARMGGGQPPDRPHARQPGLCRRRVRRWPATPTPRACTSAWASPRRRGVRGRAAARRHPARAGRQLAPGDGLRHAPRRLRGGRRAHERSAGRPPRS